MTVKTVEVLDTGRYYWLPGRDVPTQFGPAYPDGIGLLDGKGGALPRERWDDPVYIKVAEDDLRLGLATNSAGEPWAAWLAATELGQ